MKKFYSTILAALAAVGAFSASAYEVTVEVDNAEAVTASYSGQTVQFVDGVAKVQYDGYNYLELKAASGYIMTELSKYDSATDSYTAQYLSSPTNAGISISEYTDGDKYKIATGNLEEMRTAQVTLVVDNPSAVRFQRSWTYESFVPTEETTVIKYVPGKETPFSVGSMTGSNFYKVTVGDKEISGSYGSYTITEVQDGDVITVLTEYPDVPCALKFNLSEGAQNGFITSVTANGEPVENWQDAQVKIGSNIKVEFNTTDYKITKFNLNDSPIGSNGYYYSPYQFQISSDCTFDVEAAPYGTAKMTVKVDKASYVVLYKGYNSADESNRFALKDGETEIEVPETLSEIKLCASSEALITSVMQDDSYLSKDYSNVYNIAVKDGSVIVIETEEIRRDDVMIVYFDSPAKANDQANQLYGYNFRAGESRREVALEEGYNTVKFGAVDGEFMISVNNGTTSNCFLYVNGEKPSLASEYLSYYFTPENGDVIKLYVGEEPSLYNLTFAISGEANAPVVTVDMIKQLESLEPTQVLPGTQVVITPAEGDEYESVKVGDTEIVAGEDGNYVFTVADGDAAVSIEGKTDGIGSVAADGADSAVYNLQGIRVNSAQLPSGIYIVGGKKVYVK